MNFKNQKIVFIGSGKVATTLSNSLKDNHTILQVYSKTLSHAKKLGDSLRCSYTSNLKKINPDADIYIIAVKDDVLEMVCENLNLKNKFVIHTSGNTPINVLKGISANRGVIWAMHSFAGKTIIKSGITFFIEGSNKKTNDLLKRLVKHLKGKYNETTSEKRAIMHLVAVFINNFPNHLYAIAEEICKKKGIPFELFTNLAIETAENLKKQSPSLSQTGPAWRNDTNVLTLHRSLLEFHAVYLNIYNILTASINTRGKW